MKQNKIKIFSGNKSTVNRKFIQLKKEIKNNVWLYTPSEFPVGWLGVRVLMETLKNDLTIDKWNEITEKYKSICSFIMPELIDTLNTKQKNNRYLYKAKLYSHTNRPDFIFEAVAELLNAILEHNPTTLLLPEIAPVDYESLQAFITYYRMYPENETSIFLGFDTDMKPTYIDEKGITWDRNRTAIQNTISAFLINGTKIDLIEKSNTKIEKLPVDNDFITILQKHPEFICNEKIKNNTTKNISELVKYTVQKMEQSFENFSFRAAVKLGLNVLEKGNKIDSIESTYLHSILGTAAHFLQFSHDGNSPFDNFLESVLVQALLHEQRPEIRSALLYRLAFTIAERKENIERGLIYAQQAIDELSENILQENLLKKDYLLSWTYSIRAFIFANQAKVDLCTKDINKALNLLQNHIPNLENSKDAIITAWKRDYNMALFSHIVHQVFTGEELVLHDYSMYWHTKTEEVAKIVPRINHFDTFHWVDFYRNKFLFKETLEAAKKGIIDTVYFLNGTYFYIYNFSAGDIAYRIGDLKQAAQFFEKANEMRPLYNDMFTDCALNILISDCYVGSGELEKANFFLDKEKEQNNLEIAPKILAKKAIISALKGNEENARKQINEAINLAVESGELITLVEIATLGGKTAQHLTNNVEAEEAYLQALELVNTQEETLSVFLPTLLIDIFLGILQTQGYNQKWTLQILELIPKAIDTTECWSNLIHIGPFVKQLITDRSLLKDNLKFEMLLSDFIKFSSLRKDCENLCKELTALCSDKGLELQKNE